MSDRLWIALDLETTGRKVALDHIIQIGIATLTISSTEITNIPIHNITDITTNKIDKTEFCELVKPNKVIPPEVVAITGITNEDVEKKGVPLVDALEKVNEFFNKLNANQERILVGYNITRFDFPLLLYELRRKGISDPIGSVLRKWKITYVCDLFPVAKMCLDTTKLKLNDCGLPCYKLESIFECLFHEKMQGAHNALYDSKGLLRILAEIPSFQQTIENDLKSNNPQYCFDFITWIHDIPLTKEIKDKNTNLILASNFGNKKQKRYVQEFILYEPWFTHIENGSKSVEGRRGFEDTYKHLIGEYILFRSEAKACEKKVIGLQHYPAIESYLENEPLEKVLPGITCFEAACAIYYQFWTKEKIQDSGGIVALYLE
jgi:DNA polymerase III epsilon subunit-like protein/ASC-1-like (ASCH) protein